ncbi:hypothetical protein EJ08DRAFT_234234 [Tothia fuscella]|uniref:Lipocalin-like domain-containing protein n=1 Tax=Tothia fuscella TaxID=1048955 RepID=A0A9P4U302_9PEZI|nr:hypothetical protein EJ08DRAFT_234234 [Tothia fuscella]
MTNNCQGIILHTSDSYVSAQMAIPGQPKFDSENPGEAEMAECGRGYFAYSVPYHISENGGKARLRHDFRICNRPNLVGQIQTRDRSFEEGDQLLVLSTDKLIKVGNESDTGSRVIAKAAPRQNI